jgi:ATP-independent RNA helicase DbpA
LSEKYQHEPVHVKIDDEPETMPLISQTVYLAEAESKVKTLIKILKNHQPRSALVFCNLKATVAELKGVLDQHGFVSGVLHGDLEQPERDRVMAMFRNRSLRVLVATDVAARGLDVEDLDMVINLDVPYKPEVYLHRIGRTGRAGKSGLAISIASAGERMRLYEFEREFGFKLESAELDAPTQGRTLNRQNFGEVDMRTLMISGGRKDKVRPGDILGALTGQAGELAGSEVGKIEIHDRFAYVAVASSIAEQALQRLRTGKIKGRMFQVKMI